MSPKYQIFVSSTYTDLKQERDLIIKAMLEMGHIPVGMEMFSAADEEQWEIIKKQIDQTDYYIIIIAHRYGSCTADGISYTEKEYDYAISRGIPTLGFIIDETISWPREKSEKREDSIAKLNAFKEKVRLKPVSFWRNQDDLYGRCSIAMMKAFNAYPREGWVRVSQVQDATASKEVIRLSSENAALRERVAQFEQNSAERESTDRAIAILRANKTRLSIWKKGGTTWEAGPELTLYQIFEILAPELQVELDLESIARFLAGHIAKIPISQLRETWPTPRNQVRSILADFAALNCVVPSKRKKMASDTNEYWCLGRFGIELLAHMRRRRLEKIESLIKVQRDGNNDDKDM